MALASSQVDLNGGAVMEYVANGERWDVYLSEETPLEGVRSLIFHCTSNSSNGWRVAEVPAAEYGTQESLDGLDEAELDELFARSQPFDYSHDPKAHERHIGDPGTRSA
jgi:hypothetical protein